MPHVDREPVHMYAAEGVHPAPRQVTITSAGAIELQRRKRRARKTPASAELAAEDEHAAAEHADEAAEHADEAAEHADEAAEHATAEHDAGNGSDAPVDPLVAFGLWGWRSPKCTQNSNVVLQGLRELWVVL